MQDMQVRSHTKKVEETPYVFRRLKPFSVQDKPKSFSWLVHANLKSELIGFRLASDQIQTGKYTVELQSH